jgi:type IV pilus assembly protein PilC
MMKTYNYLAKSGNGLVSQGEINAENADSAAELLSKKSLTPISIKEKPKTDIMARINDLAPISSSEKVMFSKQLATLVAAGIPISQSMRILEKQTENPRMKKSINEIAQDIEGGLSLSGAMEKQKSVFSSLYSSMIKAGEVGGILDETLEKMAEEIEKEHELVAKIRGAMAYPMVILIAMILVVIYMITNIIPQIGAVFTEMGGDLPGSTKFLLDASEVLSNYGIFILAALIGLLFGIRRTIKGNQSIRYRWHSLLIKIPVFGKVIMKINIARFTRTLGSLLSSGVTVLEALETSGATIQNEVYKKIIFDTAEKVKNGSSMADPLRDIRAIPFIVPQMISVGEETGTMDVILKKLTDYYDKEIDNTVKNLSSLIEPLMMIFIGISVGFIVISIISPIYQMSSLF